MKINAYFTFNGNAREAMEFYRSIFGGEFITDQTFGEAPGECPPGYDDKIMHIHYEFEGCTLMASDGMPGQEAKFGDNLHLSFDLQKPEDVDRLHKALSEGGESTMDPQDTFWGARFAMCKDQFGICWMFNCNI